MTLRRSSLAARLRRGWYNPTAFVVRRPILTICLWLGVTAWSVLTLPALHDVFVTGAPAPLPSDVPSMAAGRAMKQSFDRAKSPNIVLVVLTDSSGVNPVDEQAYRQVVSGLATNAPNTTTATRPPDRMISADHKSWILPVYIAGEVGSPTADDAYRQMVASVQGAVAHTVLTASFLGPQAAAQSTASAGASDTHAFEIAAAAIVLIVLLIAYRSLATALLPLCATVVSIMLARSLIARLAHAGLPESRQSIALVTAIMLAIGLAQAMVLLSRYHAHLRSGTSSDDAVNDALATTSRPLIASAIIAVVGAASTV